MAENRMLSDEILLALINKKGSGGGTTDYEDLENLPQIGGVELKGNKSLADLGIASAQSVSNITNGESINNFANVETALATKQNATDNSLDTDAKTIVGAINEHEGDISSLRSGFTNLDNEVNGDATTYPYADVITIEDAVPANLAECNVKIEPDQNLHGYDHPWVGGAGKNKFDSALIVNPSQTAQWIQITLKANTQYTVSSNVPYHSTSAYIFAVGGTDTSGATSETDGVGLNTPRTVTTDSNGVLSFAYKTNGSSGIIDLSNYTYQIEEGSTATDYTPYENLCPISGHTDASVTRDGVNLFPSTMTWELGAYGTAGNKVSADDRVRTSSRIAVRPNTQYTISFASQHGLIRVCQYDSNYTFLNQTYLTTFITDANCRYITMTANTTNTNVVCQLELGSKATPYVPYASKTYTIALGDTIYGGTVDFDSGVMTVDRAYVAITTLTRSNNTLFYKTLTNPAKRNNYNVICDREKSATAWGDVGVFTDQYGAFMLKTAEEYSSGSDCIAAYGGELNICYELATPTTIQLTTQQIQLLKGTNTLTASTGQISVTVNGVSGAIGSVQEQVNDLQGQIDEIELPSNPSADGSNLLLATTVSGETTKSWVSESLFLATVGGKLVDCNTETSNGIIRVLENSTNMPSGAGDGVLIVFRPATDNVCVQMFIESGGKISERINWYGTWSAWKTMAS